jgi:membrane protein
MSPFRSRLLRALFGGPRYYLRELWVRLNTEPVFIWAQAIAFKVLVAILPLILIATGIFGLVLRQENPFETVANYLRTFLPPGQSGPLVDLLSRLQAASPALTLIGLAFLFVVVVTLFSVLRYVVGTAMGSGRHRYRSLLHGYLFDVRMIVQVGLLFVLSFSLTLGISFLDAAGQEILIRWGLDMEVLARGQRSLIRGASIAVPWVLSVAMFSQLYYFIPRPRPPVSSAFFGAMFTAVLFEIAKNAFALYATYLGRFDRYTTGDEALGGVFGIVIAFVLWVYFSGLVLIIGAVLTHLHEIRHHPERIRARSFVRKWLRQKRRAEVRRIADQESAEESSDEASEFGMPDTPAADHAAGEENSVAPASELSASADR